MDSNISPREHQLLLDAIKDHAIFLMDTTGHIISWNEGAKRLKGFDDEDVLGQHFRMLFIPEDRQHRPDVEMQQALQTGRYEEDWWRMRKDGSLFWAHVILQPVFDEHNQHIGFAKITTDRSEQKRADELIDFLMNEVAGYAFFLLDKDGNVAKWSRAAENITGYTEEEILGQPLSALYQHPEKEAVQSRIAQQLSKALDGSSEDEGWKVRKNGIPIKASYIISPLHNKDGFVVMIRDLTDQLAMEQTIKTKIALEASNRELARFAQIAGHDLKEPIRKIATFCDYLKPENPQQKEVVEKIIRSCKKAKDHINDILEFSTIAHTELFIEQDLNFTVQQALDCLSELIRERQAVITCTQLPVAHIIPGQMEHLLQNLIANAIKFCCIGDAAPLVQISSKVVPLDDLDPLLVNQVAHAASYLQISVQDNGIGFDQQYASQIFGLFTRLHGRAEYEGTGTGLAIAQRAAECHGGSIRAFSQKGKGSLFVITLPIVPLEQS